MKNLSLGWLLLLCTLFISLPGCDDDDDTPNNPVIGTIFDRLAANPDFETLTAALEQTGLDALLDVPTNRLTVFAPNDAAFSGVDLSGLSDDELADILRYHVIVGTIVRSGDIPDGASTLATANEQGPADAALPIMVSNTGGSVTLNGDVSVVAVDDEGVNGVVHTIDGILMPPSLADRAVLAGNFTTLLSALERTGLDEVIADGDNFTIFAPTDQAFTDAGIDLSAVSDEDLSDLLLYHVLGTSISASGFPGGTSFYTSLSESGPEDEALSLAVTSDDGVTVNGSSDVVLANVFGTNGVIHAVDEVLAPQSIVDFTVLAPGTQSLEDALPAGIVNTLSGDGPFTVFAPVNAAFTAAADTIATLSDGQLATVLTYHALSGNVTSDELAAGMVATVSGQMLTIVETDGTFTLQDAAGQSVGFITTDVQGTNGVIHLIDAVLLPNLN